MGEQCLQQGVMALPAGQRRHGLAGPRRLEDSLADGFGEPSELTRAALAEYKGRMGWPLAYYGRRRAGIGENHEWGQTCPQLFYPTPFRI